MGGGTFRPRGQIVQDFVFGFGWRPERAGRCFQCFRLGFLLFVLVSKILFGLVKDPCERPSGPGKVLITRRLPERGAVPVEGIEERLRRRKQPLFQQLQNEFSGEAFRVVAVPGGAQLRILSQQGMGALLIIRVVHRDVFQDPAREFVGVVPILDFALQPPNHDGAKLSRVRIERSGEALPIQQFEKGCEAFFVAVVRRRREEQLVLEVLADFPEGLRPLRIEGVVSGSARGKIMRFVHNEDVEVAESRLSARVGDGFTEDPERVFALQIIHRRDQAGEVRPWIRVEPALPPELFHKRAIDDPKFEAELLQHFVPPLDLQWGWTNNDNPVCAMTKHQFQRDEAGFDSFAQADVIGDEEIDTGHLDRPNDRVQLIAFGLDSASKGRLKLAGVGDGRRTPPNCVQKCFKMRWLIEALRLR